MKTVTLAALALAVTLASGLAVFAASVVGRLTQDLPDVSEIEGSFGLRGAEVFRPPLVYDRTGSIPLYQVLHPLATDRRWLRLTKGQPDSIPDHFVQATIAILDPTFWTNPGYDLEALRTILLSDQSGKAFGPQPTLTQRLVNASLLPVPNPQQSKALRAIRSALLAANLTSRQSKEQILIWYLNSAYYGMWAYGVDAAALVYFGKHASDLTLAESALIAGLPMDPRINPVRDPVAARELQKQVLDAMVEQGWISPSQARQAARQSVEVMAEAARSGWDKPDYADYLMEDLSQILGEEAMHRSGIRVITTLDHDLMLQSACAAKSHLLRLAGDSPGSVVSAKDGTPCLAAGLLPTIRPGDAGVDHNVANWALVILDPTTAELLALHGAFDRPVAGGPMLVPFIYLTSLAKGNSPATMVLDIPTAPSMELGIDLPAGDEAYRGPVSLRSALANLFPGAATRTLDLMGLEDVLRTARQMGVEISRESDRAAGGRGEVIEASLLDLTAAYGIIANDGRMVGRFGRADLLGAPDRVLRPVAVLRVEDASGNVLYEYATKEQPVLSAQLAFLMADALSDESARWPSLGQPNLLEINRPAAAVAGNAGEGSIHWTMGFTPNRVVGAWIGAPRGESLVSVDAQNGSLPIWNSVMRYATAELAPEGWEVPPGVGQLEICEPSGLLPTQYCPRVVQEYFVHGTEPTHYDGLFQPFRINKETGKLATLFTPLDQVEERVYLVLPPEAQAWGLQAGIERPPEEYDSVLAEVDENPLVRIGFPQPFDEVSGQVTIRGAAASEGFRYYRLQYGQGLNPARWVQIGQDQDRGVVSGILGRWLTEGLNGLYTLQLMVVLEDGQVKTASAPLTIDNQPPEVRMLTPEDGEHLRLDSRAVISLQAEAFDAVALERVEFYANGRRVALLNSPPFVVSWSPDSQGGMIELSARAYDRAGNWTESESIVVQVSR